MAKKTKTRKEWYSMIAPSIFNGTELSKTLAEEATTLKNRTVKFELRELMPNIDKNYMNVFLQVDKVEGNKAHMKLIGHDCSRNYLYRLARKRTDKLDFVYNVKTKDEVKIRMKVVAITLRRAETSTKKEVLRKIKEKSLEVAKKTDFDKFMIQIFTNQLQKKILKKVKKVYPLRVLEFKKTEVL